MPTSATHITIVQRLALSNAALTGLLGDPLKVGENSKDGLKTRFANLGAIGPDVFYMLQDTSGIQDLHNFLAKVGGTFQCIADLMNSVSDGVEKNVSAATFGVSGQVKKTFDLLSGTVNQFRLLMVDYAFNYWPRAQAPRQQDKVRDQWSWGDYVHYIRTGKFTYTLLTNAGNTNNPNLYAYALGYLTHYVTDVVGHAYVNQVVQGPWRLYWQRHHLVENFIDGYVWDRWHQPAAISLTGEPDLDKVTATPNAGGPRAPYSYSRLHDHINIGGVSLGDPVDPIVAGICANIRNGAFDLGIAENLNPSPPNNPDFIQWTNLMAATLKQVYNEPAGNPGHPMGVDPSRAGGYPTPEDIGAAYGLFRLLLKFATEDKIQEPTMPDIQEGISAAIQKLADDIDKNLARVPPMPQIGTGGGVKLQNLCEAMKNAAEWMHEVMMAVGKTVFDFIQDAINAGATVLTAPIKYALYLLNKALFSVYRTVRFGLVLSSYVMPYTEDLVVAYSQFNTSDLWRSKGDPAVGLYPSEEQVSERKTWFSNYRPFMPPRMSTPKVEQPPVDLVAPYRPRGATPTLPDDFIGAINDPPPPSDMFLASGANNGPAPATATAGSFTGAGRNYGGALANCAKAIVLWTRGSIMDGSAGPVDGFTLPDYNLDADRGYGWPAWDVTPKPTRVSVGNPLDPTNPANSGGVATVNAVKTPD